MNQKYFVDNIFEPIIKKNERIICYDEETTSKMIPHEVKRLVRTRQSGNLEIYSSDLETPYVVSNPNANCKQIGVLTDIEIPNDNEDAIVELKFDFRYATLHVYSCPKGFPDLIKESKLAFF